MRLRSPLFSPDKKQVITCGNPHLSHPLPLPISYSTPHVILILSQRLISKLVLLLLLLVLLLHPPLVTVSIYCWK